MRTVDTRETVIVMSSIIDTISGRTMTRISFLITFFRSGVPVSCKKKYIHTSKYSLINWFYFIALQLTVSCTWKYYIQNSVVRILFLFQNSYDC